MRHRLSLQYLRMHFLSLEENEKQSGCEDKSNVPVWNFANRHATASFRSAVAVRASASFGSPEKASQTGFLYSVSGGLPPRESSFACPEKGVAFFGQLNGQPGHNDVGPGW
jgi:hypothetical protein